MLLSKSRLLTTVTRGIDQQLSTFKRPHVHLPNGFDGGLFDPSKYTKKMKFSELYIMEGLVVCMTLKPCAKFPLQFKG